MEKSEWRLWKWSDIRRWWNWIMCCPIKPDKVNLSRWRFGQWELALGLGVGTGSWNDQIEIWLVSSVHVSVSHLRPGGTSWLTPPIQVSSDSLLPRPDQTLLSSICTIWAEARLTWRNGTKNKNIDCNDFYCCHITFQYYLPSIRKNSLLKEFPTKLKVALSMKQN